MPGVGSTGKRLGSGTGQGHPLERPRPGWGCQVCGSSLLRQTCRPIFHFRSSLAKLPAAALLEKGSRNKSEGRAAPAACPTSSSPVHSVLPFPASTLVFSFRSRRAAPSRPVLCGSFVLRLLEQAALSLSRRRSSVCPSPRALQ